MSFFQYAKTHLIVFCFYLLSGSAQGSSALKVLTFNVENLFDSADDPERLDETYLPKEQKRNKKHKDACYKMRRKSWRHACLHWDWDQDFLTQKLSRIGKVIESAFKDGPDLVFLQEVENKRVLNQLFKEHLAGLGFSVAHLIEGRDPRGIDVAILHKGKDLAEPFQRNFVITRKKGKRSNHVRPFLVTTFSWNGKKIAAISVHLPSPRHPPSFRVEGLKALTVLAKELSKENDLVIAGGDFNVSSAEDSRLYRHMAGKDWMVSHHEACKRCLGTNYYKSRDSWSFLDAILILRETGSARFKSSATRIVKDLSFQQTSAGRPARMHLRGNRLEGISDHFALASIVEISSSPETSKIN